MDLTVTTEEYAEDIATQTVWSQLSVELHHVDGIAYYRHPMLRTTDGSTADLTILARPFQPIAIRCLGHSLEHIDAISDSEWTIGGRTEDSPVLQIEDFLQLLQPRFKQSRVLRQMYDARSFVALPNIASHEFRAKFSGIDVSHFIFSDYDRGALTPMSTLPTDDEWRLAQSVFQSAAFAKPILSRSHSSAQTLGDAIKIIDSEILLLDKEQEKAAVQLPAGPQRIRGLAGTGKTVLLAMKAANLHIRFPERTILFTFNTQSLYNTVTALIDRFFKTESQGQSPDWNKLHVRHGWGGREKRGVYSDICSLNGATPISFAEAKRTARANPLAACAGHAIKLPKKPNYDHVLVDEAQDLPTEFFRLLIQLTQTPHAIYWAFDEMQNLTSLELPRVEEQFGRDETGKPLISLDGEYPGGIEKDIVLQKSYRCPGRILVLAHAIGLGLYSERGCVQILPDEQSWNAVGYERESGELKYKQQVVMIRPASNSPNRAQQILPSKNAISSRAFPSRDAELQAVADDIIKTIRDEAVAPEHIVVVSLNALTARQELQTIQRLLFANGIQSVVPGVLDASADFGVPGMVTLASVYRAKGNEAPLIYVTNADMISSWANELEARNKAFTAISRAKGWVRISGVSPAMDDVESEITRIMADYPRLKFEFPDPAKTRQMAAESTRRRRALKSADKSANALLAAEKDALKELDPEKLKQLLAKLEEAKRGR